MRNCLIWPLILLLGTAVSSAHVGGESKQSPASSPAPPSDTSKEAIVIERFATRLSYEPDGSGSREVTAVIRVQSDAGVRGLGVLRFQYTSANDAVDVDYVRVRKPDGKVIATPDLNIQDMPADVTRVAPVYSDIHEKHATVKALSAGDVLEYKVRFRTVKPQVPGHFWYEHAFLKDSIIQNEELEISVPKDKYVKVSSPKLPPQVTEEAGRRIYRWKTANLTRDETLKKPKRQGPQPGVQLTTFRSWEEVGRWYGNLQKPQVTVTPEVRAKAAEITEGLATDEAKLHALYDFVSTRVHYISLSFGVGRYQPHSAEEVLGNEYGDCKDKHTLLAALLKASGYDAWPVLINSSRQIDPDLPSPGQFNHVISVVPLGKETVWLDTTPEVAPLGLLISGLRDKQALVVPPEKSPLLMKTPDASPFPSSLSFTAEGKLTADGTVTAHMERSSRGDEEVLLRAAFRYTPQAQWKDLVQRISYAGGFGGEVSNVSASPPENLEEPFRLSYDYTRKNYGDWDNHRIVALMPLIGIEQGKEDEKKPSEPLILGAPGEIIFRSKMTLPPKFEMQVPSKIDLVHDFAEYHATYSFKDGVFSSERRFVIKKPEVPLAAWDPYLKFRKAVADDHGQWITLTGGETKEARAKNTDPDLAKYDPKELEASDLHRQADAAGKARDYRTALNLYKEVIKLWPKYGWVWNNIGQTQLRLGLPAEAVTSLKKALEFDPQDEYAYRNLARAYIALGNSEQALEACRAQIRMRPEDNFCNMVAGNILLEKGKYAEAIPLLQTAARITPDEGFVYVSLGSARLSQGDTEGAMADFKRALQVARIPSTWMSVSNALAEHKVHLDEALQYANSAAEVTAGLLQAMIEQKQYAEAWTLSEELVGCWDAVAYVHLQRNELDIAEKYASAAWKTKLDKTYGANLTKIYEAMGDRKRANQVTSEEVTYFLPPSELTRMLETAPPGHKAEAEAYVKAMLSKERRDVLPLFGDAQQEAADDIWLVMDSSGKVLDLQFVEQKHTLDRFADQIHLARFDCSFPDTKTTAIVRRGRISCSPQEGKCSLKLLPGLNKSISGAERALIGTQH